ncbi:MAG: COR domain-containing protein [Bacteroidia bacterium]
MPILSSSPTPHLPNLRGIGEATVTRYKFYPASKDFIHYISGVQMSRPLAVARTPGNCRGCTWTRHQSHGPFSAASARSMQWLHLDMTPVVDISPLKSLAQMQWLSLRQTLVSDLSPLQGLVQIQTLWLNQTLVSDLSPLKGLVQLQWLDLDQTKVANLSPLEGLKGLQELHLTETGVADLSPLGGLESMDTLFLAHTFVADLSPLRMIIEKGVKVKMEDNSGSKGIIVQDCPLTNPPVEVTRQGNKAILKYWAEQEFTTLYEAKVLLVGDPRAGKTSLYNQMFAPTLGMPPEAERTEGIDIHHWTYKLENGQTMRLNIWDFGGQEILHTTHQFFLTQNSLYILLDDTSVNHKNVQDDYFKNWLGWIELLGGESPVFIFQNEKKDYPKRIDLDGIRRRFPNVLQLYRGNLYVSEVTDGLRQALQTHACQLPHIGAKWPKRWLDIRKRLEEFGTSRPYIFYSEYLDVCNHHGEDNEENARIISQSLHHLGALLHYQDDKYLGRIVILQNEWATVPVYRVLRDAAIMAAKGRFIMADLTRLWHEERYRHNHVELLALMERFELCYFLEGSKPETWLIPQLLEVSAPVPVPLEPQAGDVVVRYRYVFMPKGLLNRLMTRMNRYVTDPSKAWTTGVLFEKKHARLLVTLNDTGDELVLRAQGEPMDRFELLSIVSDDLDELNGQFDILPDKLIQCPCQACSRMEKAHTYLVPKLEERLKNGRTTVECENVPYQELNVSTLLFGIGWNPETDLVAEREYGIGWQPNMVKGNKNRNPMGNLKEISIFLASSCELEKDRREFEIFINRENKRWTRRGVFFRLEIWEDFYDAISETRKQDDYNKVIRECDVFISLFFTKAGKYTQEEFDVALAEFKRSGKHPRIFTYFQNANVNIGNLGREVISLLEFKERLQSMGHFPSHYENTHDLQFQIRNQLERVVEGMGI